MSIINSANSGSNIPALFLLDKRIREFFLSKPDEDLPEGQLLENSAPNELFWSDVKNESGEFELFSKEAPKKLQQTYNFWNKQGFWPAIESQQARKTIALTSFQDLPKRLLKLMASKSYELLDGNDIEPFIRALCVYLALPQHTFVGKEFLGNSNISIVFNAHMPERSEISSTRLTLNDSERKGFFDYGVMTGFLERVGADRYVVDPTRAVEIFLEDLFPNKAESISISEFIKRLNGQFSVFDGGEYRLLIEELMKQRAKDWRPIPEHQVSASLSIALLRLNLKGKLYLDLGSDTVERKDLVLPGNHIKPISHVRLAHLGVNE
ncbi:TPA: hypothetical protein NKQ52_004678 [Vibrio parahaemolyticus]|nr:hypothetical protein [Vibrio parahaemolyticus]MDF4873602.1 protein DpdG [Vibrio parahaemolyticus]HCG8583603.1 hypothetical protein [Vibrio parahaemolyticus]HCG9752871.1 hypothetical protein [Vibrio parahaemolyticus]HCH1656966.1 hypothetical protein [Vibrio parahaemolyticus]